MPRISVIMPMYNGLPYVSEAIESIINQTFQDWELLVVDDGSTDGSPEVVRGFAAKDSRIKLIPNNSGTKGEGPARNVGIDNARDEYVAMMDADDISLPERLELQTAFMDRHPDVALVGCYSKSFGRKNKVFWSFSSDMMIKALLFFHLEPHGPSIMFRKAMVTEKYPALKIGTDTHFIDRICLRCRVATVPKILYRYRMHPNSTTHTTDVIPYRKKILQELMPLRLGFVPTPEQIDTHAAWRWDLTEVEGVPISAMRKWRWIAYVLIHGKYKWYEMVILAGWCAIYTILKRIDVMVFGE